MNLYLNNGINYFSSLNEFKANEKITSIQIPLSGKILIHFARQFRTAFEFEEDNEDETLACFDREEPAYFHI